MVPILAGSTLSRVLVRRCRASHRLDLGDELKLVLRERVVARVHQLMNLLYLAVGQYDSDHSAGSGDQTSGGGDNRGDVHQPIVPSHSRKRPWLGARTSFGSLPADRHRHRDDQNQRDHQQAVVNRTS